MNVSDLAQLDTEQAKRLFEVMKSDYQVFAKVCMSHIVTEIPEFHKRMYEALNLRYENNGFVIFRGGSKSTLSKTIQCTSDICFAREPFTLMISESIDQASKDLVSIADEIDNNEIIKKLFGNLTGTLWNKEEIESANGAFLKVKGYGSRLRGLKWKSMRVTKMILDDYESEYNTGTSKQRQAVKDWVDRQVIPAGIPGTTTYQYFGTIVHKESHLASLKDLPSFRPPHGFYMEVPVETGGVSAWPRRFPMSYIKAKETEYKQKGGLSSWLQEMYHIPARSGRMFFNTSLIKETHLEFNKVGYITYLYDPISFKKIPCNVYIGVDPASSLTSEADNTIIAIIAVTPDNLKIILDIIVDKISPTKQRDIVLGLAKKYSPVAITIETQGYQGALEDIVRERMNNDKEYYSIRSFKSNKSKNNKWLEGLEPDINAGCFFYTREASGMDTFFKEAEAYNREDREHDDSLDGVYLANLNAVCPANFDVDEAIRHISQLERDRKGIRKKAPLNYMLY